MALDPIRWAGKESLKSGQVMGRRPVRIIVRIGLDKKMALGTATVIVVFLVVATGIQIRWIASAESDVEAGLLSVSAASLESSLRSEAARIEATAARVGEDDRVGRMLAARDEGQLEAFTAGTAVDQSPCGVDLTFFDVEGRFVAGSNAFEAQELSLSLQQKLVDGQSVTRAWVVRGRVFWVSLRGVFHEDRPRGYVVAALSIDKTWIKSIGDLAHCHAALFGSSRNPVTVWRSEDSRSIDFTALTSTLPLHSSRPLELTVVVDGEESRAVMMALPIDRHLAVLFLPESKPYLQWGWSGVYLLLAAGGVLSVIGICVALWMGRGISVPLKELGAAADRLAGGDLGAEVRIRSGGEMGWLGDSFNKMARQIEHLVHEVQEKADRAEAANRAKDGFLSSVSHELRTPLTGILSTAQILLEFGEMSSADEQREFLRTIQAEATQLQRRFADMLRFASLSAGNQECQAGRCNLEELCRAAIHGLSDELKLKPVSFSVETHGSSRRVVANADELTTAIEHLLHNAWVWSEANGEVQIDLIFGKSLATVAVSDRGPGVPEAEQERMFEWFQQGGSVLVDKPDGFGLGLAIVRAVAQRHGGEVQCEDRRGGGAVFRLLIGRPGSVEEDSNAIFGVLPVHQKVH